VAEKTTSQSNSVFRYFREVRGELRKVTWPTREESQRLTGVVIAVTVAFALFFWTLDTIFSNITKTLIDLIVGV